MSEIHVLDKVEALYWALTTFGTVELKTKFFRSVQKTHLATASLVNTLALKVDWGMMLVFFYNDVSFHCSTFTSLYLRSRDSVEGHRLINAVHEIKQQLCGPLWILSHFYI